jgi:hypothetical protein
MAMNTFLNFLMTFLVGNKYSGALHLMWSFQNAFLQIFRGSAATNIPVLCTLCSLFKTHSYKY